MGAKTDVGENVAVVGGGNTAVDSARTALMYDDEALYIDAGHDILSHAVLGSHVASYGSYLSGAPTGYPIVAAVLDTLGGLNLVRLFSLVCLLICTLCVQRSSQLAWIGCNALR